jgi:hypothetical protein
MITLPALRGFDLAFDDGDGHGVMGMGAAAGVGTSITQPGGAYVTAAATLTGYDASTCTTDATALVVASTQDGAWFGTVDDNGPFVDDKENTKQLVVTTGAPAPLTAAMVLLQSFFARFAIMPPDVDIPDGPNKITMGASEAMLSQAPGQFSFESTRWMSFAVFSGNEYHPVPADTCTASYVWVAIGAS